MAAAHAKGAGAGAVDWSSYGRAHALHDACGEGDLGAVERLLKEGAPVDTLYDGRTPLAWAVAADPPDLDVIKLLLRYNATVKSYAHPDDPGAANDALCLALKRGRFDILELLLRSLRGPLRCAQAVVDAAAEKPLDVLRLVLANARHYGVDDLDPGRCIEAYYVACAAHGAAAAAPAVVPDLLAAFGLRVILSKILAGEYGFAVRHAFEMLLGEVMNAGKLKWPLIDTNRLIAFDSDLSLLEKYGPLPSTHACAEDAPHRHPQLPALFHAIAYQSPADVEALVSSVPDRGRLLSARDFYGQSALHRAICNVKPDMVDRLLRLGAPLTHVFVGGSLRFRVPTDREVESQPLFKFCLVKTDTTEKLNAAYVLCDVAQCMMAYMPATLPHIFAEVGALATAVLNTLLLAAKARGSAQFSADVSCPIFDAMVAGAVHSLTAYPEWSSPHVSSLRCGLVQLCHAAGGAKAGDRMCTSHTTASLLLYQLVRTARGAGKPASRSYARSSEGRGLLPVTFDSLRTVDWAALVPVLSRSDRAPWPGSDDLTSIGSLYSFYLRVPAKFQRLLVADSAPDAQQSSLTAGFWREFSALMERDWCAHFRQLLTEAAAVTGEWWVRPDTSAAIAAAASAVAACASSLRCLPCACAVCRGDAAFDAQSLQSAAAAFCADASVGSGLSVFNCAVANVLSLDEPALRALWPALLHAAAFYVVPSDPLPSCLPSDGPVRDPSGWAAEALWTNVLFGALRLRELRFVHAALGACAAGSAFRHVRLARPAVLPSVLTRVVLEVTRSAIWGTPLLPRELLQLLLDTLRLFVDAPAGDGVDGGGGCAGDTPSQRSSPAPATAVVDDLLAGHVSKGGGDHLVRPLLWAGLGSAALVDRLLQWLLSSYVLTNYNGAARAWALAGAAGWGRRIHALAARARARRAEWAPRSGQQLSPR